MKQYINISFPFKDNLVGQYFASDKDTFETIRSYLFHLIITKKGTRIHRPTFGTDLMKFIFEPNDTLTQRDVEQDIRKSVNEFIPDVTIKSITFNRDDLGKILEMTMEFTINSGTNLSVIDSLTLIF